MPANAAWLDAALKLIRKWEGCKLDAYLCPARVPTIGYGATGPGIKLGVKWTQAQAETDLLNRVTALGAEVKSEARRELTDGQLAALVSFTYNVGIGRGRDHPKGPAGLKGSTLLAKVRAGDMAGAAREFPRWNKGGGRVLPGLVSRRADERKVFES